MKKLISVFALSLAFGAQAMAVENHNLVLTPAQLVVMAQPSSLINWKVGDEAHYQVSMILGKGKMDKSVESEEGNAIWIKQYVDLSIQKQTVEMLMDRDTAKILKFKVDGKEQAPPDDKIEIISQDSQDVTVPAGTFKSIHVVAKSDKVSKIEMWANPKDTCMDGGIKQIVATGILGDMTIELTSFKRMP